MNFHSIQKNHLQTFIAEKLQAFEQKAPTFLGQLAGKIALSSAPLFPLTQIIPTVARGIHARLNPQEEIQRQLAEKIETSLSRLEAGVELSPSELEALNQSLESYAQSQFQNSLSSLGLEIQTLDPHESLGLKLSVELRIALDDFHSAEASEASDEVLEQKGQTLLAKMQEAESAIQELSISNKAGSLSSKTLRETLAQVTLKLSSEDYAVRSGEHEFVNLSAHPQASETRLSHIKGSNFYIPEGTRSKHFAQTALLLAQMDMNGTRPLTVDGLKSLGFVEQMNRFGEYEFVAPDEITLDGAFVDAILVFKKYLVKNGLADGIDMNSAAITPRTVELLLENRREYVNVQLLSNFESQGILLNAAATPVKMIFHGAVDTFGWLHDVEQATRFVNHIPKEKLSASDRIQLLRATYGATHPMLLEMIRQIREQGINNTLNNLSEHYESAGRGRQLSAITGALSMVVPLGYVAYAKIPSAFTRLSEVNKLLRVGKISRLEAATRLGGSLAKNGFKAAYELQLGIARDVILIGRNGSVFVLNLKGQALKAHWNKIEAYLLNTISKATQYSQRIQQKLDHWKTRLQKLNITLTTKEIRIRNPFAALASAEGPQLSDESVIRIPWMKRQADETTQRAHSSPPRIARYEFNQKNPIHEAFRVESEVLPIKQVQQAKDALENLTRSVKQDIENAGAITVLEKMNIATNTILRLGYKFESAGKSPVLFAENILAKSLDCDTSVFVYAVIADELGIPYTYLRTPNHMVLRVTEENGKELDIEYEKKYRGIQMPLYSTDKFAAILQHNKAVFLYNKGRYREAISAFNQALAIDPNLEIAFYGLGFAKLKLEDYRGSHADFTKAFELNPRLVDYQLTAEGAYPISSRDKIFRALDYFLKQ